MDMGFLFIICAVGIWGLEYVLIKAAASLGATPWLTGLLIFSTTSLVLGTVLCLKKKLTAKDLNRKLLPILLIGFNGFFANVSWIIGTRLTSVLNASLIGRADVLFAALLAWFVFREKIKIRVYLFGLLMLSGIIVSTVKDVTGSFSSSAAGDYLILISAFFIALNAYLIKRQLVRRSGLFIAFINVIVNTLCFLMVCVFNGDLKINTNPNISMPACLILVLCGVASSILFICYYAAIRRLAVFEVRLFCLGIPLAACLFGWFLLREVPTLNSMIGGAFILAGAGGIIISRQTTAACSAPDFDKK